METDKSILCKAFMEITQRSYFDIFEMIKSRGDMTLQLQEDFMEFHNTVNKMFEAYEINFSMDRVYEHIPQNTWIPVYLEHIKTDHSAEDFVTADEAFASMQTNSIFQKICVDLQNNRRFN